MARKRGLRTGFSTGTAAAAAAKAALLALLEGRTPQEVALTLPMGQVLQIPVEQVQRLGEGRARATVMKDAGDDPDVTHKARVSAEVRLLSSGEGIVIRGGEGVGRVTRPGLPVAVGEPAINPVPRRMIRQALEEVWRQAGPGGGPALEVEISVAEGERLARRTLNPRLGILGGISILGTTGLVKPFSHEAYTATIASALDVAAAAGEKRVVFTTGGKSEKRAMRLRPELPELCFVQIADFFGFALGKAGDGRFSWVGLVSFFGKALKQAQGLEYTHAHKAPMDLGRLADWLRQAGEEPGLCDQVAAANTARHALDILRGAGRLEAVHLVGRRLVASARRFAGERPALWVTVLDYDDTVLFQEEQPGGGS